MDEIFLIEPTYDDARSMMLFQTESLNGLATAEYNSHFGFYQSTFGVYNYMRMNQDGEFVIHYMSATPLMWQPHNSCAWDPTGNLNMDVKTITPCKAKLNEQQCYDEYLDSAYKYWLTWGGPTVEFTPEGVAATNQMVRLIMQAAAKSARATMVAGQLFDVGAIEFQDGLSTDVQNLFRKTTSTCRGWIPLLRAMSQNPGKSHLDTVNIVSGDISTDSEQYTGDFVALYDSVVAGAPRKLRRAIKMGGAGGFNGQNTPMFLCSYSIAESAYDAFRDQSTQVATNMPRLTKQTFPVSNGRGGTVGRDVYYIDNVAIIPVEEVTLFEEYVTGTSHFAYLTLGGVIQLGGSFSNIPGSSTEGTDGIAMMIERSDRATDYGTYRFLSHALFATAINDTDYIAGGYKYFLPA